MEDDQRELQLLPTPPHTAGRYSRASPWPSDSMRYRSDNNNIQFPLESTTTAGPSSLDLQLSISLRPIHPPAPDHCKLSESFSCIESKTETEGISTLKWKSSDQNQFQIATSMEKAYVERMKEMTKREMELAQSEFSRARHMWERAREEVERVEKMKERATRRIDNSSCSEITCQICRQKFRH